MTDHHALIVTENLPSGLSKDEQAIYDMVAARLLEAFSAPCIKEVTEIHAAVGSSEAQAKGTVVKSAGWRAVRGEKEEGRRRGYGTPKSGTGRDAPDKGTRSGRAADQTQAAAHRKLAALGDGALRPGD